MKSKFLYITLIVAGVLFGTNMLQAQNTFKSKLYLYGGNQHNIFKAPKSLFDRTTDSYVPESELMISDMFQDVGYDVNYKIKKKKYVAEIGSDLWYRNYNKHSNLNQSKIAINASYIYSLTKKINVGAKYKLAHSNKIGTSITGDDLTRSFIYIQNRAEAFVSYEKSKKSTYTLTSIYDHKNYYKDTTSMSLNYYHFRVNLEAKYKILKKHTLAMNATFTDRHYSSYLASDSLGKVKDVYGLRHFRYYGFDMKYNHSIKKNLSVAPFVSLTKRDDLHQDYYSYLGYKTGLGLKYKIKKLNIQLEAAHKKVNYEVKTAPVYDGETPNLEYAYLTYRVKLEYELTKRFNLYGYYSSDSRDTNTELEHWKTRRSYNRNEFMVGVNYNFRK